MNTSNSSSTTANDNIATPAKKAAPRKAVAKAAPSKPARKAPQKAVSTKAASKASTPSKTPAAPSKTPAPATAPVQVKTAAPKTVASPSKPLKDKKVKVVRDSFTIPKSELLQIGESKKRALALGIEIKKSELIRAGLQALTGMNDAAFKKALANVPTIKTGRPAKS